jgi:hypothetical protein
MEPEPTEDPLRTLLAEEVTRGDGRYLIYYGWPPETGEAAPPTDRAAEPGPEADV